MDRKCRGRAGRRDEAKIVHDYRMHRLAEVERPWSSSRLWQPLTGPHEDSSWGTGVPGSIVMPSHALVQRAG